MVKISIQCATIACDTPSKTTAALQTGEPAWHGRPAEREDVHKLVSAEKKTQLL
jgi:hypothetical protein